MTEGAATTSRASRRPRSVTLAAILLGSLMVWRFGLRAVSGLIDGSVSIAAFLDEVPALIFWLVVIWQLLALQRLAWWISVVAGGLLAVGGATAAVMVDELLPFVPGTDPKVVLAAAMLVGFLSAAAFVLLMLPASRSAFRAEASAS